MNKPHDDAILVYTQGSVAFPLVFPGDCDEEIGVSLEAPDGGTYGEMNWQFKTFTSHQHGVQMRVFGDGLPCLFDPRIQWVVERWRASSAPDEIKPAELIEWLRAEGVVPSRYQIEGMQKLSKD
jgi:hypothetical protein